LQVVEAFQLLRADKQEINKREVEAHEEVDQDSDSVGEIKLGPFYVELRKSIESSKVRGNSLISSLKKVLLYNVRLRKIYLYPFLGWEIVEENHQLRTVIPIWAREATRISSWEDLERAEEIFIKQLPEESFLKQAFLSNKRKLGQINTQTESRLFNLNKKFELKPGQSISFTFYCKAPDLLHEKKYDAQFETSYFELGGDGQNDLVGIQSTRKTISFQASSYAIPSGAFLGGISGFFVRQIFLTPARFSETVLGDVWNGFLIPLLGTVLLSWILAIVVKRSDDSKKFITIEDFSGGFFIGAIAGLFSQEILDYLRTLLPSAKDGGS